MAEDQEQSAPSLETKAKNPLRPEEWILMFGDGQTSITENIVLIAGMPLHDVRAFASSA